MKSTTLTIATATLLASSSASASLVITEFFANPAAVNDADGEFFEVYNSGPAINLADLTIGDDGTDSIDLAGQAGVIGTGEFFVFANHDASYVDFNYDDVGTYILANSSDEIVITLTSTGDELARVVYSDGDNFGITGVGVSQELININLGSSTVGADGGTDFVGSTDALTLGNGDLASPGVAGNTIVPEPSSLALLGLGGLLIARRRHN